MRLLGTTLALALLASGAATAQDAMLASGEPGTSEDQGFITREWVWSTESVTTTFTAFGPSLEVMQLDPEDRTPFCDGCELASSVQFEPEDESVAD